MDSLIPSNTSTPVRRPTPEIPNKICDDLTHVFHAKEKVDFNYESGLEGWKKCCLQPCPHRNDRGFDEDIRVYLSTTEEQEDNEFDQQAVEESEERVCTVKEERRQTHQENFQQRLDAYQTQKL